MSVPLVQMAATVVWNGNISEEEEEIDMCQAVDEMIEDGRKICRRDGKSG